MFGTVYYTLNKENCREIVEQFSSQPVYSPENFTDLDFQKSSTGREYLPRKLIWLTRKAPEISIRCLIAQFNQIAIF